ncbi:MAG: class I SAM-dependent methyltransferase [Alphaproteobacteria bacterium]|nr:class I SAM-dependent methyltransferase [Alphaproteobacteria bacterium]
MAAVEDRMWWTRALRRNLLMAAEGHMRPGARILDAGCGTGSLLATLAAARPATLSFGVDRDGFAAQLARGKSRRPTAGASVDDLPFCNRTFDLIFSADVLCHRGVRIERALGEMRRCLRPGGALIINLPAYRWLYSAHDRAVDNVRRFGRGEVVRLLAGAGFAGIRATHWNALLFPLMLVRRLLPGGSSEVGLLPAPVEQLFGAAAAFESGLLRSGLRLPFGGSILAAGTRP